MAALGRLIVTLAAEVAGYSSLLRADEKGTLEQLGAHREQLVHPKIAEHSGRIVRATGDRLLVEFESPTEAVRCAVELQSGMIDRNMHTLPDRRITFRVGVTVDQATGHGDDLVIRAVAALPSDTLATLIKPGVEIYGERGNIAMRLAALAEPAGICISDAVQEAIRDQLPYRFEDIGEQNLEICAAPVHCYAMNAASVASITRRAAQHPPRRPRRLRNAAVAGGVFAMVGVWGVALVAWLGTNSSTLTPAPVTAGSRLPSAGIAADGAALASPSRQSAVMSSTTADKDDQAASASQTTLAGRTVADRDTEAPGASQPSLASKNAAVDSGIPTSSARPALSETGAIVVRGNQAPSTLQTTDDNGAAALRVIQAPSVLQPTANSGAAVVRGKEQASALQTTPDSGAAVVRGNHEPSPLQIAPDGATDVVRGTRVFSGAAPSSRSAQK
jgi:class 3 adenylate cyclase